MNQAFCRSGLLSVFAAACCALLASFPVYSGEKLGYLVWGKGEPVYFPKGKEGAFKDGELVSLIHDTEGFDFHKDNFTVSMKVKGKTVSHRFQTTNFMGKSAWLVVDPAGTDATPAFTDKFLAEICTLPAGKHSLEVIFSVNDKPQNQGNLVFTSDGKHEQYKKILARFKDVAGSRKAANEAFQKEQEAVEARQSAADATKQAADHFRVTIQNKNTGKTAYIIVVSTRTLSENIHEVPPGKSKVLELYRNQSFTLKCYRQDEAKSAARNLGQVDKNWDKRTITVQ